MTELTAEQAAKFSKAKDTQKLHWGDEKGGAVCQHVGFYTYVTRAEKYVTCQRCQGYMRSSKAKQYAR